MNIRFQGITVIRGTDVATVEKQRETVLSGKDDKLYAQRFNSETETRTRTVKDVGGSEKKTVLSERTDTKVTCVCLDDQHAKECFEQILKQEGISIPSEAELTKMAEPALTALRIKIAKIFNSTEQADVLKLTDRIFQYYEDQKAAGANIRFIG